MFAGFYRDRACPKCRKVYAFQVVNAMFIELGTGLGPPLVRCASCGAVFDSELTEWLRLSDSQKSRYVFLSILYAIVLGMVLALLPVVVIGLIFYPAKPSVLPASVALPVIFVCSFPVLGFQLLRVHLSNKRIRNHIKKPMDVSYWNWETNPQGCWLSLSTMIIAVFCLIAYFEGAL